LESAATLKRPREEKAEGQVPASPLRKKANTTNKEPEHEEDVTEPQEDEQREATSSKYAPRTTRAGTIYSTQDHAGGGKVLPGEKAPTKYPAALVHKLMLALEEPSHELKIDTATGDIPTYKKEDVPIPRSYKEAIKGPHEKEWRDAMEREYRSLLQHKVATPVPRPKDRNVIDTRWVLSVKVNTANEVKKFKGRNVAKGFTQIYGDDYTETFSPTSIPTTVRYISAHAAAYQRPMFQCDVSTAFLNAPLEEEIFIEPPEGYRTDPNVVWRLNKCLYGLKQSARAWNQTLSRALATIGFQVSTADPCMFTRPTPGHEGEQDIMSVHVDDIRGSAPTPEAADKVLHDIKKLFDITINQPTDAFLGVETKFLPDGSIQLHQEAYIKRMLQRFGMTTCKTVATPMTRDELSKSQCTPVEDLNNKEAKQQATLYRAMVGSLNYLAVWTRPDIMFAVSQLGRFLENPGKPHHAAARRVFQYLQGTPDYGITYPAGINKDGVATSTGIINRAFPVVAKQHRQEGEKKGERVCEGPGGKKESLTATTEVFADSSYATNPDTRKSTTGVYVCVNGRAVLWYSKQQPVVATSTTEAEYIALSQGTKEALWLRKLQGDLQDEPRGATRIYEDNQACIRLAANPEAHARTKHIDIRFHMIRDYVEQGAVEVVYVDTNNQVADMLTKALPREGLTRCNRVMAG
jgi:hypothetical protein